MSSGGDLQYLEQNRVVSLFTHRRNRKRITSHACRSIQSCLHYSIPYALRGALHPGSERKSECSCGSGISAEQIERLLDLLLNPCKIVASVLCQQGMARFQQRERVASIKCGYGRMYRHTSSAYSFVSPYIHGVHPSIRIQLFF